MYSTFNFHINGNVSCINLVPRVFSISNSVQKALLDNYGVKSAVIENGILTDNFQQCNKSLLENGDPLRVVCVSRLEHKKKGQDLLIETASKVHFPIEVTFIGDGISKVYLQNLADSNFFWGGLSGFSENSRKTILQSILRITTYLFNHLDMKDLYSQLQKQCVRNCLFW